MPPVRLHKAAAVVAAVQVVGEPGAAGLLQAAQPAGLDDRFHETCIMEPMG
jgi:hypothetical protein